MRIGPVTHCQICGGGNLTPVLSYGNQAVVQAYRTPETTRAQEVTYPLNLVFCTTCGLLQLDYVVPPAIVFPRMYPYRTGLTSMLVRNFRSLAEQVIPKYGLTKGDLVVDIGSNDGTLLAQFKSRGMRVLGVEPTDAAKDANKSGIPTLQKFFDRKVAQDIRRKYGGAKLITATNVFAHIPDALALARATAALLASDGVFISESQYFRDTFEKLEFDCVYHEHLRYYTLKPLVRLLASAGFCIVDAERISAAGGSIRVCAKKGNLPMGKSVKRLIREEEKQGFYGVQTLRRFGTRAIAAKRELLRLVADCAGKGVVAGLGSPARSNSLLGFARLDKDLISYIGEKTGSPKIGLLTPGTHIPVVDEREILRRKPPYLLILSWHIGKELMDLMRKKGYKGKFIVPLPKPRIIS